jgi:hypothetical protein
LRAGKGEKKMKLTLNKYLLAAMFFIFAAGCATMQSRYKNAESTNTIEAYENFIRRYPQGKLAAKAQSKLAVLYLESCYKIRIPDAPQIREFLVTPNLWLQRERGDVLFRWRVEPGPGGSPIRTVTITRTSGEGPRINHSSTRSIGEYTVSISTMPGEGRSIYSVIATDENLATTTRNVVFEVKSIVSVREDKDISLVSLETEPAQIREGEPFTFILRLNNRSGLRIPEVNIPIRGEDLSQMRDVFGREEPPPNQGELSNQIIMPGMNEYRLRCTPGIPPGLADSYVFVIIPNYKRISILWIVVPLDFIRDNLYRILVFEGG